MCRVEFRIIKGHFKMPNALENVDIVHSLLNIFINIVNLLELLGILKLDICLLTNEAGKFDSIYMVLIVWIQDLNGVSGVNKEVLISFNLFIVFIFTYNLSILYLYTSIEIPNFLVIVRGLSWVY